MEGIQHGFPQRDDGFDAAVGRLEMLRACLGQRATGEPNDQAIREVVVYNSDPMKKKVWRALVETAFIIFLFYSNLLMGEFERSGMGRKMGLAWAVRDILTTENFLIAVIAALIGYILVEYLRERF